MEVAERFFAAIQAGDLDAVRASYHPDARIWHNFDQLDQTPEENLRVLAWMVRKVKDRRYEDVRRIETPTGFAQQHVLRGVAPNGEQLDCPAAVFCTIEDGLITRLEEYLDTAQTAVLSR
ncbi:MAG: ketosteroid isomerase [Anaerolinea sp.]|nr:ketosteroid isomerase [Anaerolinea sp.]